jgi:sterol desaturase/sphingolipid hydroxylase (fatty acid hydroxylase superfamily)
MLGFIAGMLYANMGEWIIHKYVLHGLGRDKRSFWSFHWHDHHRNARRNDHVDADYRADLFTAWNGQSKEAVVLAASVAAIAPLAPVAPFFVSTMIYSAVNYYRKHKRAHLDPAWAREHLPWHYDHHMGPNQDANWCVTRPWFDHLMGTRERYAGTEREQRERDRRRTRVREASVSS